MSENKISLFEQEWITLQNNYEQYERYALFIKLTSVVLCFVALMFQIDWVISVLMILVLWMQEAIWKTYQSRMGDRLLTVERAIKNHRIANEESFQLHTDWQAGRAGILGLIREYLGNSIRPTVMYPHAVLVIIYWVVSTL